MWFFAAAWTAGDTLTYYGAVLTFLGTVFLSALALWQNHIIDEKNRQHAELLEHMEKAKNAPKLIIDGLLGHGYAKKLTFHIKTVTENPAFNATVSNFNLFHEDGTSYWHSDRESKADYISESKPMKISLNNPEVKDASDYVSFEIKYEDSLSESYRFEVIGRFADKIDQNSLPKFKFTEKK